MMFKKSIRVILSFGLLGLFLPSFLYLYINNKIELRTAGQIYGVLLLTVFYIGLMYVFITNAFKTSQQAKWILSFSVGLNLCPIGTVTTVAGLVLFVMGQVYAPLVVLLGQVILIPACLALVNRGFIPNVLNRYLYN